MKATKIDVLEYLLPSEIWRLSHYLATASSAGGQPTITQRQGNQIWYIKGVQGYPWDMMTFDDKFVYQSITEQTWTDPKTFKMFVSLTKWPGANGGIVWCPRYDVGAPSFPVSSDSTYRTYINCMIQNTQSLGGPVFTSCGYQQFTPGGDLPVALDCFVVDYQWNPGLTMLERNFYARGFGLVCWQLHKLVNGQYVKQQESLFNAIVNAAPPEVKFPCGVPIVG